MPVRRRRKRLRLTQRAATGAPRRRSRQTQYSDVSARNPAIKKMLTCIKIRQKTKLLISSSKRAVVRRKACIFAAPGNLRPCFPLYDFLFRAEDVRPPRIGKSIRRANGQGGLSSAGGLFPRLRYTFCGDDAPVPCGQGRNAPSKTAARFGGRPQGPGARVPAERRGARYLFDLIKHYCFFFNLTEQPPRHDTIFTTW